VVEEARRRVLQVRQRAVQARRNVRVLLEGGLQDLEDVPVRHLRLHICLIPGQASQTRQGSQDYGFDFKSSE
jgi:hypothetical protein